MNLVALLICMYLRANPDRDSTHSSLQNVQSGRVTIYRGRRGPCGMDQGRVCCGFFFFFLESGSFEIAEEGAAGSGVGWWGGQPYSCHANLFCHTTIYSEEQKQSKGMENKLF